MANTGPGRPQDKNSNTGTEDAPELEKTLEDATTGVVEAAQKNSNLIVFVVLCIVGLLALPSVLGKVEEEKLQKLNDDIDACLNQDQAMVLQNYPTLLTTLQGTPVEAYAYSRVAEWMWDQQDETLWEPVVTLLATAQEKFPEDFLLKTRSIEYSGVIESSKNFELPEAPVEIPALLEEPVVEVTPEVETATEATDPNKSAIQPRIESQGVPVGEQTTDSESKPTLQAKPNEVEKKPATEQDSTPQETGGSGR